MKKRTKILLIAAFVVLVLAGIGYVYLFCGGRVTDATNEVTAGEEGTDSLVVYFTRSDVIKTDGVDAVSSASLNQTDSGLVGNTEIPARIIQELTGADLYAIKTERYYRSPFMGTAATAWIEESFDMRPALAAKPDDLDKYDVIYVGYPIWWFNAPMAVGTFLESYDLSGKKIVPFCTSQDNGIDVSMDYIREVCGDAEILESLRIYDNTASEEQIRSWLTQNGLLEE